MYANRYMDIDERIVVKTSSDNGYASHVRSQHVHNISMLSANIVMRFPSRDENSRQLEPSQMKCTQKPGCSVVSPSSGWDQAIKCKIIQELNMNKLTYALKVHMQVHARGEGQGDFLTSID